MSVAPSRAIAWTALPLALALTALVVRETTRPPRTPQPPAPDFAEYVPPLSFLALTRARGDAWNYVVDEARSFANASTTADGPEQRFQVSGRVQLRADDVMSGLELDLLLPTRTSTNGWPPDLVVHLRGSQVQGRRVSIPGVHAGNMRCSIAFGRATHEALLDASWIHLPGGGVELHGVVVLAGTRLGLLSTTPWRMLTRDNVRALGIDLVLRTEG